MSWFRRPKTPSALFGDRDIISRQELRQFLKQDRGVVPGTLGKRFNRSERIRLEREVFAWKKYGKDITKDSYQKALLNLRGKILRNPEAKRKETLSHKLRYLNKLGGL